MCREYDTPNCSTFTRFLCSFIACNLSCVINYKRNCEEFLSFNFQNFKSLLKSWKTRSHGELTLKDV